MSGLDSRGSILDASQRHAPCPIFAALGGEGLSSCLSSRCCHSKAPVQPMLRRALAIGAIAVLFTVPRADAAEATHAGGWTPVVDHAQAAQAQATQAPVAQAPVAQSAPVHAPPAVHTPAAQAPAVQPTTPNAAVPQAPGQPALAQPAAAPAAEIIGTIAIGVAMGRVVRVDRHAADGINRAGAGQRSGRLVGVRVVRDLVHLALTDVARRRRGRPPGDHAEAPEIICNRGLGQCRRGYHGGAVSNAWRRCGGSAKCGIADVSAP